MWLNLSGDPKDILQEMFMDVVILFLFCSSQVQVHSNYNNRSLGL